VACLLFQSAISPVVVGSQMENKQGATGTGPTRGLQFIIAQQHVFFHQHRGIAKISPFVFINIVGYPYIPFFISFVFINIVGYSFILSLCSPLSGSSSGLGPLTECR
jgi:hypothetical protein